MRFWSFSVVSIFSAILIADFLFLKFSGTTIILDAALATCIASLFTIIKSAKPAPTALLVTLYMALFYLIPGLIHVNIGAFPFFNMSYKEYEMELAAICVLLFSCFFWIGYIVPAKSLQERRSLIAQSQIYIPGTTIVIGICLACLGFAALTGFTVLNTRRGDIGELALDSTPWTISIQALARSTGFLGFVFALSRFLTLKNLITCVLLIIATACFLVTNNPISLPRYVIAANTITILICFFALTPLRKGIFAVAVALGQVTIFPAVNSLTRGDGRIDFSPMEYLSTHGDFDGFQSTINVVRWVNDTGIGWGRQLLSAILFFVPRSIWDTKSPGTGLEAAAYVGYPFVNISAPLPSEFFADLHIFGPVFMGFIFGHLVSICDETFRFGRQTGCVDTYVVGSALAAGYAFIVMRGSLVSVLGPFVLSLALVVCIHLLSSGKSPFVK